MNLLVSPFFWSQVNDINMFVFILFLSITINVYWKLVGMVTEIPLFFYALGSYVHIVL